MSDDMMRLECCARNEILAAGALARLARVESLLATWEKNRADPRYGTGTPGPLYSAGMAAEADSMIAGLRAALNP